MKTFHCVLVVFVLLITATSSARAGQPEDAKRPAKNSEIDLRPKFKIGKDVKFKMTMTSRSQDGKESPTETSQEMTLHFKAVKSDPEQGTTLEMSYDALKFSMGEITFDSSKPADSSNPMDGILRSIVGLKMNVAMDAEGNITSVTSDQSAGIGGMLADQFTGADVVKGLFGPISAQTLSRGHAKVGESWTSNDSMTGALGGMKLAMKHTLEYLKSGKARIRTEGKVVFEASESLPGGVKIKDSRITGTTLWDVEAGMLDKMTQENIIEVESADDEGAPISKQHSMKVDVSRIR